MLQIYGSAISAPTNKVRYVANYLQIPHKFHNINLGSGEQRTPAFLKINPLGKIPAIEDNGFGLGESNAIIRYLADKQESSLYPRALQKRAIVDQWLDYATQHVFLSISKIMFNTYYYKLMDMPQDLRSLEDGRKFLAKYLPVVELQLSQNEYLAGEQISLADMALLAALDGCELSAIDLSAFPAISQWKNGMQSAEFYRACHDNFTEAFKKAMTHLATA